MFDFSKANDEQKEAITHTDGALLITAGPGTGKTFTLVQRAVYLIQEKNVSPEQIMIATFTEKAAKEIVTRITNELAERNISVDVNEMYIGTFHSICLRFIKDNLEYTDFKKNYRMLDSFDQQYLIFQNYFRTFKPIENIDLLFGTKGVWKRSQDIANLVNTLNEELVDYNLLCADDTIEVKVAGEILCAYNELLKENNMLDFSTIQTAAYRMLKNNKAILEKLQEQIQYIMIDEYQDTNYIQEQIVFLLGGEKQNIAVVGDDDQGLYRFRGATIRNILEFPSKFADGACKRVSLVKNYRSDSQIVDFYNEWMATTGGASFRFDWGKFRYDKTIKPNKVSTLKSPSVVTVASDDDEDEWHENVLAFIKKLLSSGKVTNLNQIAFLFNSVKGDKVIGLAEYLEKNGINIYSPRSNMFFQRDEIMLSFGCLLLAFPAFVNKLKNRDFGFVDNALCTYYESCIKKAAEYIRYQNITAEEMAEKGKNPGDVWTQLGDEEGDVWEKVFPIQGNSVQNTMYPTQKPEALIERIIKAGTKEGGLVFDCFMGSGTTQAVAMKLGRRFIGADINLGAIQTTTKRLIGIANELNSTLDGDTKYTGFEVYNVNNYDFFRNPVEARDLIISALDIDKFTASSVYDGELDGRMVKIMPVNRIATKADLAELIANMPYKTFEQRKADNPNEPVERITLVCMGHEPDLKAHLIAEVTGFKLDVEIVDILRDKADLQLKREAEAVVVRKGNKLVIEAFYPMNLMQKLSLQKEFVDDWKQLVESVMVDFNYDGAVLQPTITDIPGKNEFVLGEYEIPETAGTIRVKITDLLSESLEIEVE